VPQSKSNWIVFIASRQANFNEQSVLPSYLQNLTCQTRPENIDAQYAHDDDDDDKK
jgi:hypothetical protein